MLNKEALVNAAEEDFMNAEQREFMRKLLLSIRESMIPAGPDVALVERASDPLDRAQQEEQWMVNIRRRSLETDLLSDVDRALQKLDSGDYGYCEYSGEPIDIRRLLACPTTCTTVEEQDRIEKHSGAAKRSIYL